MIKDISYHISMAERWSKIMDEQFSIFGIKVGIDPIIGLLPGVGDTVPFALAVYHLWIAHKLHVPTWKLIVMLKNILVDVIFGTIPLLGDIFDIGYKAHSRNMKIIKDHLPVV